MPPIALQVPLTTCFVEASARHEREVPWRSANNINISERRGEGHAVVVAPTRPTSRPEKFEHGILFRTSLFTTTVCSNESVSSSALLTL